MGKMEFTYTSGWEEFENYCGELYSGIFEQILSGK